MQGGAGLQKHCLWRAVVGSAVESSALLWASAQGMVRMGVQVLGLLCANSGAVLVCSPQPLLMLTMAPHSSPPQELTSLGCAHQRVVLWPLSLLAPIPFQTQFRVCYLFLRAKNCYRFSLAYLSLLISVGLILFLGK